MAHATTDGRLPSYSPPRSDARRNVLENEPLIRFVPWVHPRLVGILLVGPKPGGSVRGEGDKAGGGRRPVRPESLARAKIEVTDDTVPPAVLQGLDLRIREVAAAIVSPVGVDVNDANRVSYARES